MRNAEQLKKGQKKHRVMGIRTRSLSLQNLRDTEENILNQNTQAKRQIETGS